MLRDFERMPLRPSIAGIERPGFPAAIRVHNREHVDDCTQSVPHQIHAHFSGQAHCQVLSRLDGQDKHSGQAGRLAISPNYPGRHDQQSCFHNSAFAEKLRQYPKPHEQRHAPKQHALQRYTIGCALLSNTPSSSMLPAIHLPAVCFQRYTIRLSTSSDMLFSSMLSSSILPGSKTVSDMPFGNMLSRNML
jgi:hypothetical protein